jgi:TIR domain-containing protein/HEAT repeat protein
MNQMAWQVFYSYSHKDAELRERLATYLAPLRQQQKIIEWYDRKIEPGANWDSEISAQLESAHLILFLLSADFLASEYCFGVEVEKALARLKRGEVQVVPILLKPCLWEESRFSELQIIPRDAKAIISWASPDEAFKDVASEIRKLISDPPPSPSKALAESLEPHRFDSSLDLIRGQVHSYAHLYERTRQRMRPSNERTHRMEQIFEKMRNLATASYPLLDELARSPSPGERLAAVAILQVFAADQFLPFLVKLVGSEKPFVGYHATKALQFAAGALDPSTYPLVLKAIKEAQAALTSASVGFDTGRQAVLRAAEDELQKTIQALTGPTDKYD